MKTRNAVLIAGLLAIGVGAIVMIDRGSGGIRIGPGAQASFSDCAQCPQMVTVPAGEYVMGSPSSEMYRGAETQQHVTIPASFAASRFEITFDQ